MKGITFFAGALLGLTATSVVLADGMTFRSNSVTNGAIFRNGAGFAHKQDPNLKFTTAGDSEYPVIVASQDTGDFAINESGGFFANGQTAAIWSPGEGASAPSDPPAAILYILDEDMWSDADGDPYDNGAIKAYVSDSGLWQTSDQAMKTNITRLSGAVDVLRNLNGYSYEFVHGDAELQKGVYEQRRTTGVLAQELQQVLPEAVSSNANGELWVNYSQITPVLIEAIKEQQAVIDELRERLDRLDGGGGAPTQ